MSLLTQQCRGRPATEEPQAHGERRAASGEQPQVGCHLALQNHSSQHCQMGNQERFGHDSQQRTCPVMGKSGRHVIRRTQEGGKVAPGQESKAPCRGVEKLISTIFGRVWGMGGEANFSLETRGGTLWPPCPCASAPAMCPTPMRSMPNLRANSFPKIHSSIKPPAEVQCPWKYTCPGGQQINKYHTGTVNFQYITFRNDIMKATIL